MGATVQSAEISCWDYIPHLPCPWKVDFAPMVPLSPHPFVMLLKNPGGSCSSSDIQAEHVGSHDIDRTFGLLRPPPTVDPPRIPNL